MVEERNELQESEPVEEEISSFRVILGFTLTLLVTFLLIPFLFLGACMGIFDFGTGGWIIFGVVIAGLFALLAFKTKNPGVRVAIILIFLAAAALAIRIFGW